MADMMNWCISHRGDPRAAELADRHYNRQKIGSPQFVPPGRCHVLLTPQANAVWVTSWPFVEYVKHEWAGAWMCSLFRNEGTLLSSKLITQALAATRWKWDPPPLGCVTFVNRSLTRPKKHPGYCYRMAGWNEVGKTKGGLTALQILPDQMPEAEPWLGAPYTLELES